MQQTNRSRFIGIGLALVTLALPALAQNNAPATGAMSSDMSNMMYGSYNTGLSSPDQQALTQALGGLSLDDQVILREKMYEMLPSENHALLQTLGASGSVQGGKVQWGPVAAATMPAMTMPGSMALAGTMPPAHAPMGDMKANKIPDMMQDKTMPAASMDNGSKHHRRRHRHDKTPTDTTPTDTTSGATTSTGTSTTTTPSTGAAQ